MEMMENCLLYSVSVRKGSVYAKKSVVFSIIFETVWILFSLHFKAQKNRQKKDFIFCFCPVPLLFHFFKIFFPFSSLSSLLPLFTFSFHFFVHLFLLFSPFSFLSFLLPFFFFSISVFLFLLFLQSHVSLSFFPSPFCVSSFGLTHFSSLFCSWSHFFFFSFFLRFRILSFMSNQIQKFLFFFFEEDCFLNPPFFLCLISCFSSLRRPYSLSVPCFLYFWAVLEITFLDFLFIYLGFGSLQKIVVVFGHNFQKISLILNRKITVGKKNLCFRNFDNFLLLICFFFHAWSSIFPFFCLFRANILFLFVLISLFLLKKNTSKNKLILFIFVFTLLVLTLPELLSLVVLFSLFSPCLLSFFVSSCFLFSCSCTLLMFICSLWCFFCLCLFLFSYIVHPFF